MAKFQQRQFDFLVHISTIWLFGLLSKGRDVSGEGATPTDVPVATINPSTDDPG